MTAQCRWCNTEGDEFGLREIWGYDWAAADRGDEMALSVQTLLGHECVDASYCAREVVRQGVNLEALRQVARDRENLGDLALEAGQLLRSWAALMRAEAHTADLVARERGWGAIGGPRGGAQ